MSILQNNSPTTIKTNIAIIGAGFAGLYLAQNLIQQGYADFLIIAPDQKTVSDKSYYNFRSRGIKQASLKSSIIKTGQGKNNRQLVNVLVNNIDDELTRLSRLTELAPSYMGVKIVNPQKFLIDLKKASKKYRIYNEVKKIKKDNKKFVVKTAADRLICCQKLVFCAGGSRFRFSNCFNDERVSANVFKIARALNCQVVLTNKIMFHPFYAKGVCLPSDNLFGYLIVDNKGKKLAKTNKLIEAHNAHHCFDEILQEFKKAGQCFAVKNKIKIKLEPSPHYLLGGIKINKYGETNIKNVYALGECSYGLHGLGRIGGCALSEIIVMARVISKKLILQ